MFVSMLLRIKRNGQNKVSITQNCVSPLLMRVFPCYQLLNKKINFCAQENSLNERLKMYQKQWVKLENVAYKSTFNLHKF